MATERQTQLAKAIIKNSRRKKPLNKKELLVSVGYDETTAEKRAGDVIEAKGVQEVLEDYGFNEDEAKKVVAEIMKNPDADASARLKATDQVFKVHGTYAPEKSLVATVHLTDEHKKKGKSAVKRFLGN